MIRQMPSRPNPWNSRTAGQRPMGMPQAGSGSSAYLGPPAQAGGSGFGGQMFRPPMQVGGGNRQENYLGPPAQAGGSGFGGQMLRPQMTVGGMPPAGWQKSPQMNPYQGPGYRPNSINLNNLPNRQPGFGMQNQSLFGQYGPRPL